MATRRTHTTYISAQRYLRHNYYTRSN